MIQEGKSKKDIAANIKSNCVVVKEIQDFNIIYENYTLILCNILSRQEIVDAMTK